MKALARAKAAFWILAMDMVDTPCCALADHPALMPTDIAEAVPNLHFRQKSVHFRWLQDKG